MTSFQQHTTLYRPGYSCLHRLHPFTKLTYILLTMGLVYLAPGIWIADATVLAISTTWAIQSCLWRPWWAILWRTLVPIAIFMLPIHGMLYPGNVTVIYFFHSFYFYFEGIVYGATVLLQLAAILAASLLFVFSTHPADFITALTQAGWPPSFSYLFASPMLMLPAMRTRIGIIQAGQQARGLDASGSIVNRIKALSPLVFPFVLGAFTEIEQRAIALETRGFNSSSRKTSWRRVADSKRQRYARWIMLAILFLLILFQFVDVSYVYF
ncbi:energy-coupling factor transporter transmembrane component T family protein [Desulfovibrio inopinatus]|uniref:energy-coupling factor transporter transmembrane component T family protein n=1 Tax=Desulfovibrio inopinatus TaxID=102109 RepID=UPI0004143A92|nr:energy-coupling factor transporter transmembrane component T [Desulfovibrio inopinatus]